MCYLHRTYDVLPTEAMRTLDVATIRSYNAPVFSWDEKKRTFNLAKHGIDFRDAGIIFDGPLVTVEDTREDYGERRYVALGLLAGVVVSLAYSERGTYPLAQVHETVSWEEIADVETAA